MTARAAAAADFVLILVTVPDAAVAESIARALLNGKLAACVNRIGPVSSSFRWQGKIDSAEEFLLLIKARAAEFERVRTRVQELHPYEVPEVVALPFVAASDAYARWLAAETAA